MAKPRTRRPPQYPQRRGGPNRGSRRAWMYVTVAAVVGVAALAAVVLSGRDSGATIEASELTAGIPQDGLALGRPRAPVTMVEYADLQCPFCRQFAVDVLPELIGRYVRDGQLRLEFRGLAFIGEDSRQALEHVLAAAESDKAWDVADLLFQNQGGENTGWVTDSLLADIEEAVGLDPDDVGARARSAEVRRTIEEHAAGAARSGIQATPSFLIGPTGGPRRRIEIRALAVEEFAPIIEAELADAR